MLFIDPASFFMAFLGPTIIVLLISNKFKDFFRGLLYAVKPDPNISKEVLKKYEDTFDLMYKAIIAGGIIGLIIGIAMMLMNIMDPAGIGPGMALSLISPLYGLFFGTLVFLSLKIKVCNGSVSFQNESFLFRRTYIIKSLLGLLLPFAVMALVILAAGGELKALIYPPDFITIIIFIAGSIFISDSDGLFVKGLTFSINSNSNNYEDCRMGIIRVYDHIIKVSLASGIIVFLINVIFIMASFYNFGQIPYRFGVSIMPIAYGIALTFFVFLPIKYRIGKTD